MSQSFEYSKYKESTSVFPNLYVDATEQQEIVALCNAFKQSAKAHAQTKKEAMKACYAYVKNQFVGGDLLPIPSTVGNDRDIDTQRPKVFIPLVRQQLKQIYAYLKLTVFANDEDYFRVRAKTPEGSLVEDELTEALKYVFKEAQIAEKIGCFLYNLCWAGNSAAFASVREDVVWEWDFDTTSQEYVAVQKQLPPKLDLEIINPIDFYLDPVETTVERSKWGYFGSKNYQELKDSDLYFNVDLLFDLDMHDGSGRQKESQDIHMFNGLQQAVNHTEKNLDYDFYYFPFLKTSQQEYRNMLVGIAAEKVLVRFHPNLFPNGLNPVVFCNWTPDVDTLYGTGPIEDIKELQRLINILYNYLIELLARIGNRFIVTEDVDLSNLFGIAGGVIKAQLPQEQVVPITGDYTEPGFIANLIGTLKAEAQMTSGSQNPFQGAANIDFKKTATELQIIQENSISVMREVIEHISSMGVQRILERLMHLCADLYPKPIRLRVPDKKLGERYINVDLNILKKGDFTIELTGVNPSQSKQAQVNSLTQLLNILGVNPELIILGQPLIEKIGELQGIKSTRKLVEDIKERVLTHYGQKQSLLPGKKISVGTDTNQGLA